MIYNWQFNKFTINLSDALTMRKELGPRMAKLALLLIKIMQHEIV